MQYQLHRRPTSIKQGISLIEALIAIAVFSIGLLGMIKMLSISARMQHNQEFQLQAIQTASDVRELLMVPRTRMNPALIEGFLDRQACNANNAFCQEGKNLRQQLNQQLSNNLATGLNLDVGHGVLNGTNLVFNNDCHSPIYARIQFNTESMQTKGSTNIATTTQPKQISYNYMIYQYRILQGTASDAGVTCSI